jgi:hypothetical protein
VKARKFNFPNPKKQEQRTLEGLIKPEVSRGVRPIAKMKNFIQGGATGQSSDRPGRTWRSLDASLKKAIPDTAFEGSGVQRLVRESPAEEDGTVLQIQAVTFLQKESYGLHRNECRRTRGPQAQKASWRWLGPSRKSPFRIRLERGRLTGQC